MSGGNRVLRHLDPANIPGGIGSAVIALLTIALMASSVALSGMIPLTEPIAIALIAPALGMLTLYLVWLHERLWVYAALVTHLLMMIDSAEGSVGVPEVAFGAVVLLGMATWFAKEVMVHRRRLIVTGFDLLLISFMLLSTVISLLAFKLNDGNFAAYLKEWMGTLDLLLYFPLRKHMRRREDVVAILVVFALVALGNGLYAFINYKQRIAEAVYQWQIGHSRSNINETTSMGLMIMSATVFAAARRFRTGLLSMMGVAAGALFVVISLSRGPIVSGAFGIIVMMTMMPFRQSRKVVIAFGFAVLVGVGIGFIFFSQYINMLGSALVDRIVSVTSAGSDFSIQSRVTESKVLLEQYIATSPILGNGYGVFFKFLDPITATTYNTNFVHNGYIWSMFKLGIPLALMLLGLLLYPVVRLLVVTPRRDAGFSRALAAGAVGYIAAAMLVHMTSNLFGQISTMFNFALCWAVLDYVTRTSGRPVPGNLSPDLPAMLPARNPEA